MQDLTAATARMCALVATTTDDELTRPTPCASYTVGDLLDHVGMLAVAFAAAARKESAEGTAQSPPPGDVANLGPDWRDRVRTDLLALGKAWREPSAWTGMTSAGGVDLPGEVCGLVALNELVLHGWDLARGTGQPFEASAEEVEACLGFVSQLSDSDRGDAFAAPVEIPDGAPRLHLLLGLSGRDPGWRPA